MLVNIWFTENDLSNAVIIHWKLWRYWSCNSYTA